MLGQVRNSHLAALSLATFLGSPRFRLAASATGGASIATVRPLNENGSWQCKTEKEYQRIRNGEEKGFIA